MSDDTTKIAFEGERAASYDERAAGPVREALQFLTRAALAELPENARILSVGVGTGLELVELAAHHPKWRFTAVEPSSDMIAICRQRAEREGFADRCTFHNGFLETLPEGEAFDGATCLLVSHFFMQLEERRNFLSQISKRLKIGGRFVISDLVADLSSEKYPRMLQLWSQMLSQQGTPVKDIQSFCDHYGTRVAVLPAAQVENLIAASGFASPILFYQSLLISAWFADREK